MQALTSPEPRIEKILEIFKDTNHHIVLRQRTMPQMMDPIRLPIAGNNRLGQSRKELSAFIYKDLVPLESITETLLPLFESFKSQREGKESFGDYCARLGLEKLLAIA